MVKVSVIIPVFNAAKYINRCIKSILNQSMQEIELLIVNDGSIDESKEIIMDLADKDNRIIFLDGENLGVSAARNKGIKIAVGEYIAFADADDWMEPEMLQNLYRSAQQSQADLAICNVNIYDNSSGNYKPRLILENEIVILGLNNHRTFQNFMDFKYDYANWNKIYKNQIIQKYEIRFNEEMTIWEDLLFNLIFLYYTKKIFITKHCLYNYRVHETSVMANPEKDFIKEFNLLFTGYRFFSIKQKDNISFIFFSNRMGRNCYYNLIPGIVNKIKSIAPSYAIFVRLLSNELRRFNHDIYAFEKSELRGLAGVKKRLLMKGNFLLFAHIVAFKNY